MTGPVAVFGASGFIGRHLVRFLRARDVECVPVLRPSTKARAGEPGVRISDYESETIQRALKQADCAGAVNLASYGVNPSDRDARQAFVANTFLPAQLALATANLSIPLVHIGSCSEYDGTPSGDALLDESRAVQHAKLYGGTKAAGMIAAISIAHATNGRFAGLRLFNVYGPDEPSHRLFPSIMEKLEHTRRVALSDGRQVRDFIHVADVCEAVMAALECLQRDAPARHLVNICTGTGNSVRDFCEMVADACGADRDLLGFGDIERRPDDIDRMVGDPAHASHMLDWRARIALPRGIEEMVAGWNR